MNKIIKSITANSMAFIAQFALLIGSHNWGVRMGYDMHEINGWLTIVGGLGGTAFAFLLWWWFKPEGDYPWFWLAFILLAAVGSELST